MDSNVVVDVLDAWGFEKWPLAEFLRIIDEIPADYQASAFVEIEDSHGGSARLRVFYERPETPEEVAEREAFAKESAEHWERVGRKNYERLKKKFEP